MYGKESTLKAAKHPLVFVSYFKMLQKHYGRRLLSAQIISELPLRSDSLTSRAAAAGGPAGPTTSCSSSQVWKLWQIYKQVLFG